MVMRMMYTLLFYLLVPFVLIRLYLRSKRAPAYAERWGERFGHVESIPNDQEVIWVHSVSVGETLAAIPMIRAIQRAYPKITLMVTTMTPTGSERVRATFGDTVYHCYAPYDLPDAVARFLQRTHPTMVIIMETELWPNTLYQCRQQGIPAIVANARLSERSAKGYRRFASGTREMLNNVNLIAAQHADDAARFVALGAASAGVVVTGNIKFDIDVTQEQKRLASQYQARWRAQSKRKIWLAASTHAGEDDPLLSAHKQLLKTFPDLLLVLVPRHPERFSDVEQLAKQYGFGVQLHSDGELVRPQTHVLIGDTMGEMMALLGACDICFMGGSWSNTGGHNLIEPAVWRKPLLSGPSLFNFSEVSSLLLDVDGLWVVDDEHALVAALTQLLQSPIVALRRGEAAAAVAEKNRGALGRLLAHIDERLPSDFVARSGGSN